MSQDIFDEEVKSAGCDSRCDYRDPCKPRKPEVRPTPPACEPDPCRDISPIPPARDPYCSDPCHDPIYDPYRRPHHDPNYMNPDNNWNNNDWDNNWDNMDDVAPVPPGWRRPAGGWRFYPRPLTPPSGAIIPGTPELPIATPPGIPAVPGAPGTLPIEESYIENILRLNRGKLATIYATYENNMRWNAKIFRGCIEAAGRDHIIISDPKTGKRYLLLMLNVDYITFDEEIAYEYPFNGVRTFPR
ncbi:spore coat protein GerQ [Heliorestis convoluta]|uniref:Spore coat protein GerQ n=1 Tax=Heliorestis convoluta TaxID=356322 RepID=A0A5Q2MW46_9FIRM|nr:spore coat protein GerQ [Heliorestis convoluta]QGG46604.1 spore coat protein GerQ [Heliorestis convoluta]